MNLFGKREHMIEGSSVIYCVLVCFIALLSAAVVAHAAEVDLKPGDTIGPQN
jgi:hypothetical protein